jgi:hypothetical protein
MFFGAAESKHLVEGVREAMDWLLQSIGRHQSLDHVDQALDLPMGS